MNNMMTLWAEAFRKLYPNVKIQVEGKGSSHGAAGADRRHGAVRPDVPADEGHRDRPVRGEVRLQADASSARPTTRSPSTSTRTTRSTKLTLAQVDAVFSKTRKRGGKEDVTTWGQLGLTGDWADEPISLYGRNSASRHLRLLQGAHAEERRLQGHGEGAARLGLGRAGRHRGPVRHRLQRHRLQDLGRQGGAAGRGRTAKPLLGRIVRRTSSAASTRSGRFLYTLRQQARRASRSIRWCASSSSSSEQGRPGGRREGRLPAALRRVVAGGTAKLK